MSLAPPFVKVERADSVVRLTMNRPERRNALSMGMMETLHGELVAAQADPTIHVVILAGEGPAFCAGHDLKELTEARAADDGGVAFFQQTFALCTRLMLAIVEGDKPVIAEVGGIATAAGCQLAASCDIVVASQMARFATPGVNIGLFCSTPSVALTRAVPAKAAMEMLLTGEAIDAETALRIGLISRIVPPNLLQQNTMELAQAIASKPPEVIALGKRAVRNQMVLTYKEAYSVAQSAMVNNLSLGAAIEGIGHFLGPKRQKLN